MRYEPEFDSPSIILSEQSKDLYERIRLQQASYSLGSTHLTLGPIIAQLLTESSSPSSCIAKLTLFFF